MIDLSMLKIPIHMKIFKSKTFKPNKPMTNLNPSANKFTMNVKSISLSLMKASLCICFLITMQTERKDLTLLDRN